MKKSFTLFIAILSIAILFNSCKKGSDNKPATTTGSMKFTTNGTAISFNTCIVITATVNGINQVAITGYNVTGLTQSDNSFEVQIIHDIATLKAGQTYPVATAFAQPESSTLFYYPNATDIFSTQPGNPEGTVTITDVTSTTISGTFSGKLYDEDDLSGTTLKYTITSGSFTAKID